MLTLTGVETGGLVKILNDGSDVTSSFTKGGSGATLTYTANTSAFTGSETIKLTAVITDAAGNTSEASNAVTGKIDTVAPAKATLSQGTGVNAKVLTLTDVETGGVVKILNGTTDVTSKFTAGDNGTYTAKAGAFAGSETLSLTVSVTDAAGNTSVATNTVTGKIDTTAPSTPTIKTSAGTVNSTKPVISGTAEAGSTISVFDGTTQIGTSQTKSDGSWTFTPDTALTKIAHTITVKSTDEAGNLSGASAAVIITVATTAASPTLSQSVSAFIQSSASMPMSSASQALISNPVIPNNGNTLFVANG